MGTYCLPKLAIVCFFLSFVVIFCSVTLWTTLIGFHMGSILINIKLSFRILPIFVGFCFVTYFR